TPGQEIPVINGIMAEIIKQGWQDSTFIHDFTEGFEPLKEHLARYTEEGSGVSKEAILSAAKVYTESKNPCIILSSPTPDLVKAASSLLLLKGKTRLHLLGRRSNEVGAFNLLGDRDKAFINSVQGLFLIGSDLPSEALQNKEFIVVSDLYLTETAKMADVVLPATASLEKTGTFINFEGKIQQTDKASHPPCGAKSDLEIITEIALKMGFELPNFKEMERCEFKKGNFLPTQATDIKISSDCLLRPSRFHSGKISQRSKALMEVSK
ncbi:MAG: molybdopterin-dependent oxidoreductase, partial [Candidatus Desantisbacteria bacterium]